MTKSNLKKKKLNDKSSDDAINSQENNLDNTQRDTQANKKIGSSSNQIKNNSSAAHQSNKIINKLSVIKRKQDKQDDVKLKCKRMKRKCKINCEHVDFVTELGYKQYIQLVITDIFSYLNDKDITAALCTSKRWNFVLNQNRYVGERRNRYVQKQIETKKKVGLVSEINFYFKF